MRKLHLLLVAIPMSCFSYAENVPTDLQRGVTCGPHVKKRSDITEWNNPLFEGWYADPQIRLFGDTYWIFPTGKGKGEKASFEAFSSKNLKDWTRHPRILLAEDVSWAHNCLWAPDAHEKDGKYYFFFSANNKWYICYHRRPIPNKAAAHRVTCLDRLYFEENGDIKSVVMTR